MIVSHCGMACQLQQEVVVSGGTYFRLCQGFGEKARLRF